MQADTKKFKQYLLGDLPGDQTEAIDLQIITDENLAEELSLAESELIEDYLEGSLTDDEKRLFDANFMISDARRQELNDISLLKNYARDLEAQKKQPAPDAAPRLGVVELLKAYLRPLALAAAVVVLLVVGLFWAGYLSGSVSALEKEYAELNKKDLNNVSELTGYSNVILSTGSFRDANSAVRQSEEKLSDTVLFRLVLLTKVGDGSTFKAKVLRGTSLVFTVDAAKAYQTGEGRDIRMLLPKSILQKGQYQIKLENASGGEAGTFAFVIE